MQIGGTEYIIFVNNKEAVSMAKKKLRIDKSQCIGCGCCAGTYPDDITIGDDGLAELISGEGEEEVVGVCPVSAISLAE